MKVKSMGFIGGGRITRILLNALKQKNKLPARIIVTDPNEMVRNQVQLIDQSKIKCFPDNIHSVDVDLLFLAVHPPVMKDVSAEISGKIGKNTMVVSLAPVISMEKLSVMLGGVTKLVHMIPNAPSIIHKGYNPVAYWDAISADEKHRLKQVFECWGTAPEVDESKLEAYAIITAMGPTYFWPQWVKLQALGKEFGLSDKELNEGMAAMLHGSVELMYHSDLSAREVMDLIPVYPLKEKESDVMGFYENSLRPLYQKLKGTVNERI